MASKNAIALVLAAKETGNMFQACRECMQLKGSEDDQFVAFFEVGRDSIYSIEINPSIC